MAAITSSSRLGTSVSRLISRTPGGSCASSRISAYRRSAMLAWSTVPSSSSGSMAASASVTAAPGAPAKHSRTFAIRGASGIWGSSARVLDSSSGASRIASRHRLSRSAASSTW